MRLRVVFSYFCLLAVLYGPEWAREWVCCHTSILLDLRRLLAESGDHEGAAAAFDEARRRGLV